MLFVFMSQPDFACNPHALWKYIKENTNHDTGWIVKKNSSYDELKERGINCRLYDTLEGNHLIREADYVVMNSYTFQQLPKREGQVFVNLWHGSGIKAHDYFDHKMNEGQAARMRRYFEKVDLMCVQSLDDRFRLCAMLQYDLRRCYVTGQPRLDCVGNSEGKRKLEILFGERISGFDRLIFFAPSFRANMSTHSGSFCSDNIFRLDDYDDAEFKEFLEANHAGLIYKLHPIEQTAFSGREFLMNPYCIELTDEMLFRADIRYDELLNGFDVMMSDYSSIAYDFLVLDRPIVYLIPDYEEYKQERGFVFRNVGDYMPGPKAYTFNEMLDALGEALNTRDFYRQERDKIRRLRFDFSDEQSAKRCFEVVMNHKTGPERDETKPYVRDVRLKMPSSAQQIQSYVQDKDVVVIDSTKEIQDHEALLERCRNAKRVLYITGEIPNEYRRLSGRNFYRIADLEFYYRIQNCPNAEIVLINGGVDYHKFSEVQSVKFREKKRIGFAGTIDNRIFFAMVQFLCEAFPGFEVVFAGDILGDYPTWLKGYKNLRYVEASYDELPEMIQSFDVAILPFFGDHKKTVPTEFFQYLACGKPVVASDMPNLPRCRGVYVSKSVADSVKQVKKALEEREDKEIAEEAREIARQNDWGVIAKRVM